ncbi:NTP-binding protein [Moraxella osloensis]|nr:NTP-binding protein [Moraxella osloensis]RVU81045.1 NTP-binding protein [Leucothrix sargassi]
MVQITSDIELSGAGCTTAITPNQLVQSSSENDKHDRTLCVYPK